ncbi:NAD+ synthase [Bdellovibrio sp. HCB337]|uniref:NAD+ synthase n=1 Tax=Bdellovibrio sp. HCB337 TaxID=3394358 RepID=UPI0039A6AF63
MRIAIAQINPTLGDFEYNSEKILEFVKRAHEKECELVVFPESALFGYHPYDLLERTKIVLQQEKVLQKIHKEIPKGMGVLLGAFTRNPSKIGRPYFNSAAFLVKGQKIQFFHKQLLPTGDVFDEARFIQPGEMTKNYLNFKGKKFFVTICEDIWAWPNAKGQSPYIKNPIMSVPKKKIDLVINISASPYFPAKLKQREYVTQKTAQYFKAPIMYANLVGAQDEVIYDGGSFVLDTKGKALLRCHQFEEDLNVYNLETKKAWSQAEVLKVTEGLRKALVLGIRDFCQKTGLQKLHLGLSGGIDSAVVACLAVEALGPGNVSALALPGPFSSPQSLKLAEELAKNLMIQMQSVSINETYETVLGTLEKSMGLKDFGVTQENIQARLRGMILMAYSNKENSLLLTTSNKSEYAAGYSTLYGDMCGGLAPLGDLTKKQVYDLAKLYNEQSEVIPREIIDRPPSAELRPNQKDQDTLPPYDVLDAAVENIVEHSGEAKTKTDRWLLPVIARTEFKRWQAPPILKVSEHSFGRGRRWPIAHKAKELGS